MTFKENDESELLWQNKKFEELTFVDDYMFWAVMTNYEDVCKTVVELCLGRKVCRICYKEGQKSMQISPDSKGIRLDVYLEDDEGTLYDFEMQSFRTPFIGRRVRYYGGTMDINHLQKGMEYEQLPESFIVFICMFDPFGADQAIYAFNRREKVRTDIVLDDGTTVILINVYGDYERCAPEMRHFLSYLRGEGAAGVGEEIDKAIHEIKRHEKWRIGYMKYEADRADWKREGREEGRRETLRQAVRNVMDEFDVSAERAMDILKMPEADRAYFKARS